MKFPAELKYTEDHEWIRVDGDVAYVGITDFAQSELGELVYIEVDTVGSVVEANKIFGTVEAVKTTSDLYMPITAEVLEFNPMLDDKNKGAVLINEDPYQEGWIVKVKIIEPKDLDQLMDVHAYKKHVGK